MRRLHLPHILTLAMGLALVAVLPAPAKETPDPVKLVAQLGSADFEEREAAARSLETLGAPALEALRQGLQSEDPEVRMRSGLLIKKVETRIAGTTLLTGKRVRLVYKNKSLAEALADFNKQSGYTVNLFDPTNALKDRKVTLDTGDVTFWQALDKFCEAAGLVENNPNVQPFGQGGIQVRPGVIIRRQVQLAPVPVPQAVPAPQAQPVPPAKPDVEQKKNDKKPVEKIKPEGAEKPAPEKQTDDKGAAKKPDEAKPGEAKAQPALKVATVQVVQVQVQQGQAIPPQQLQQQQQLQAQVQLLQLQMQLQAQQLQAQAQLRPGVAPINPNQVITLFDGKGSSLPTDATGAIRVRALSRNDIVGQQNEKEIVLALQATPEPKLHCQFLSNVRILKAVDENGQNLVVATQTEPENDPNALPPNPPGLQPGRVVRRPIQVRPVQLENVLTVRLRAGAQPSKVIKELRGVLTAQVLGDAQPVITVDEILKAAGKSVKGGDNGSVHILEVKQTDGQLDIRFDFDAPRDVVAENQVQALQNQAPVQIQPVQPMPQIRPVLKVPPQPQPPIPQPVPAPGQAAPVVNFGFTLLDDKGNVLPLISATPMNRNEARGVVTEYRMSFRTTKSTPTRLVYMGQRTVTLEVPFTLKDVNLP